MKLSLIVAPLGSGIAALFIAVSCGGGDPGLPEGSVRVLDGGGDSSGEGTTGSTDGAGSTIGSSVLGTACRQDADCTVAGTYCLTQNSDQVFGAGPQGGLCVADCTDDSDCQRIDLTSYCLTVDTAGTSLTDLDNTKMCFQACTPGPARGSPKCHGREEVGCYVPPMITNIGVCQPMCTSDFECGDARVCDLGIGLCVDADQREGTLPIGSECDRSDDQCEGVCIRLHGDINVCSGICRLNYSGFGCGSDPRTTDPLEAMCLFGTPTAALGDDGACAQLCDTNADCRHPSLICEAFTGQRGLDTLSGRGGVCVARNSGGGIGIPAEDGGTPERDARPTAAADAGAPDSGSTVTAPATPS